MTKAALENALRNDILSYLTTILGERYDTDVLTISSSEITIPVLDAEGNEKFATIKVSIPRGTRKDGTYEPYDGYAAAQAYQEDQQAKLAKKEAAKERAEAEEKAKEARRAARAAKRKEKEKEGE